MVAAGEVRELDGVRGDGHVYATVERVSVRTGLATDEDEGAGAVIGSVAGHTLYRVCMCSGQHGQGPIDGKGAKIVGDVIVARHRVAGRSVDNNCDWMCAVEGVAHVGDGTVDVHPYHRVTRSKADGWGVEPAVCGQRQPIKDFLAAVGVNGQTDGIDADVTIHGIDVGVGGAVLDMEGECVCGVRYISHPNRVGDSDGVVGGEHILPAAGGRRAGGAFGHIGTIEGDGVGGSARVVLAVVVPHATWRLDEQRCRYGVDSELSINGLDSVFAGHVICATIHGVCSDDIGLGAFGNLGDGACDGGVDDVTIG